MTVRNIINVFILAAGLVPVASCQEADPSGLIPVDFTVDADAGPVTRASYSGELSAGRERIDWTAGDRVAVFGTAGSVTSGSEGGNSAVYVVGDPSAAGSTSRAQVRPEGAGLYWTAGATGARFFGCYPPVSAEEGALGLFEGLSVPQNQTWAASADLSAAPMVAGPAVVERPSPVSLTFTPAYTAFEITLSSEGDALPVKEVALVSATQAIWGTFGADVTTSTFACPARTPANGVLAMDVTGNSIPEGGAFRATLLALPQDYSGLTLRVTYEAGGDEVVATLPMDVTFTACHKNRVTAVALPDGSWKLTVETALEVAGWTLSGDHVINYDATVGVTEGFSFYPTGWTPSGVDIDENAWTLTFSGSSSVAYVTFTVTSPVGADWSVRKVDPEGWFILEAWDGSAWGPARGVVDGGAVVLRLRLNAAAIPASRSEDYSIILHTYVEVGSRAYNIDTETQNLEHYDYARFIVPAND